MNTARARVLVVSAIALRRISSAFPDYRQKLSHQ